MILFSLRFIRWLLTWLLILLPLQLIGAVLLLLYLPVHRALVRRGLSQSIKLPFLLRWFDNADLYVGRDTSVYLSKFGDAFWTHYTWLAFRNPLNYFGYVVLGFVAGDRVLTTFSKFPSINLRADQEHCEIGDGSDDVPGLFTAELENNDKTYFEYYYIKKYNFFGTTKCIRVRIGHKIGSNTKPGQHCQWVFVISPFHSYDGI